MISKIFVLMSTMASFAMAAEEESIFSLDYLFGLLGAGANEE